MDLNTIPEGEEDLPDLNKQPDVHEEDPSPFDGVEVGGAGHFVLHPDELDEQAENQQGDNVGHPFDLNDPLVEEEGNLHAGNDNAGLQAEQDTLDSLIQDFGVYTDDVDIIFDEEELPNSDDDEDQQTQQQEGTNKVRILTERERQDIYEGLLRLSNNGKLKKDSTSILAAKYNVHKRTIQRVWQRAKDCIEQGVPVDVRSLRPKNCGRKKIEVDLTRVVDIPLIRRGTIRSLANALHINKSSLHRLFKEGELRRHSNALKPYLKEENKRARLQWVLSMLEESTLPDNPKFKEMKNIIHSDEKWFNGTKKNMTAYLHPNEEDPHRTVQNKNAIEKVMFYSAVGRPRFDAEGTCYFDGKLGLWPFVRTEPAARKSGNRPRGTPITKTIKVDRQTMRSYMINYLIPAIQARWPLESRNETIWIQQDNAPAHVPVGDAEFATAVARTGLDIRLTNQPANSPDMNCLDLGFFASLQSLTDRTTSRNMDELIQNVVMEYQNYNPILLNRIFLTLQTCMIEVMKDNGGNKYKIPHMNKQRLEAQGMLPTALSCDRQLLQRAYDLLNT